MRIVLQPHESMKQRKATDRLAIDAHKVENAVKNNPGVPSVAAIAALTGLGSARVREIIRRINSEEVGGPRLDYGMARPTGGRYAGQVVRGWFQMNRKAHHAVMDQADEHSAQIELGIRRSRLARLMQARNLSHVDSSLIAQMEERLGVSVETMSETDFDAFAELLAEAADEAEAA